jgi:hypothetical protein
MNNLSVVTAAALFILPSAAQAKVPLVNLGGLCDSLALVVDHPMVSGFSAWGGCQTGNFVGVIGKVRGSRAIIGSIEMLTRPSRHSQFLLELSYPLADGGTWFLYYTEHGSKAKLYQQGTYTVVQ